MASSVASGNALRPLRLPRIVALLREQPLPAEVILLRLNRRLHADGIPEISIRTLQHDLDWMLTNLGRSGLERVARADLQPEPPNEFHRYRQFYRITGAEDLLPITNDLVFLTELEALALVAARAVLATPATPGVKNTGDGPLADALGTLIERLGFGADDQRIPDVLAVTQAAPQPYDPTHILAILRAIRLGEAVTMAYCSLNKPVHHVLAQPVRLVLVEGEPYVWAWDAEARKLKNYKVARITSVESHPALSDLPSGLDTEVRVNVRDGFRGVAGAQQRGRVALRLTPAAIPHLRHRRLGGHQTWDDLPDGGARVAFNTHGMEAIRHWLLQCGADVQVEAPVALVAWFRAETERMAALYRVGGDAAGRP
jgi:predicted DNA-binding transcriptional regulator YafY